MPEVQQNETREHYMARCVPLVMAEGLGNKAAVGKCEGMFDEHQKKLRASSEPSAAALFVSAESGFRPALTLGHNFPHPKERNGKPCFYYWKEVLPPIAFQDAAGKPWDITPETIDGAIHSFRLAKDKARFEPPLPASHKDMSGKNYGYVVDARKNERGSLELLHQFIGEAEKDEALNKKSSIGLLFNQSDAYGNKYPVLIDHNAILPNPVLTDLDDFQPALAASRGQPLRAVVLTLSRKSEANMAATPEQVDYVRRECYGGMNADHVDKDNAMDHLIAHHKALKQTHAHFGMRLSKEDQARLAPSDTELAGLRLSRDVVESWKPQAPAPDPKIKELSDKLAASEAKALELSKAPPAAKQTDPEVFFERRMRLLESRKDKLTLRLGKDAADKLTGKLLGPEAAPNALMLSRDNDARDCRAAEIMDLIIEAPATPSLGSQTTAQILPRPQNLSEAQLQASKDAQNQPNTLIEAGKKMGLHFKQ